MVAHRSLRLNASALPVLGAAVAGLLATGACMGVSDDQLGRLVDGSGVAALVPAAGPPLGATARACLAAALGAVAALVAWSALFLVWGPGGWLHRDAAEPSDAPAVRRADAHPDAPPRRPLSAADLAPPEPAPPAPSAPDPVERTLPADLDQPLFSFDPQAIPAEPLQPARPLPSLAPALAPGERIDAYPIAAPDGEDGTPSIEALLRRLEQASRARQGRLRRAG